MSLALPCASMAPMAQSGGDGSLETPGASLLSVGALVHKGAGGRGYKGELVQVEGGNPLSILLLDC